MIPIHQLLNRIRWDKEFGAGYFEIGYEDHAQKKIIRIAFADIHFEAAEKSSFRFEDEDGDMRTIPFHRIRQVFRDGALIWSRQETRTQ